MANLLESLGLTPQHFQNIAEMQKDSASYGGTQAGYAIKSAEDLVSQSKNPLATYMGQTFGSPIYDFSQALGKYSDKGYQGEFGLSKQGAVDFGKNLLSVGKEFLDQKPIAMMAGRTLGGIKGLGDWVYENLESGTKFGDWAGGGIYNLRHGPQEDKYEDMGWNEFQKFGQGVINKGPEFYRRKIMADRRATEQGIAQVAMQKRIQEEDEDKYEDMGWNEFQKFGQGVINKGPEFYRRKIMADRRATKQGIAQVAMQKRIQEAERQRAAAKAKAAAAAAAAAASSPYSGQGAQGGGGGSNIGGGQQTSRGPVGGAVTHSQARDARGGMSGWGLSRGGLASLYG